MCRVLTHWIHDRRLCVWFFIFSLACVTIPISAAGALASAEAEYVLENWETEAGLPHNGVLCLEQTRDGYLWVGTSNGLARFDGVRFSTFRSADYPGLDDNRVLSLFEDLQGRLWIGTEQAGVSVYQGGSFKSIGLSDGLSSPTVLAIGQGQAGEIWAGTPSGLNRSSDSRAENFLRSEPLPPIPVYSIQQPQRSAVIFATHRGLFQLRRGRVEPYASAKPGGPDTNVFFCVHQDFERRLWAGGPEGLVRLDQSQSADWLRAADLENAPVVSLIEASDGQIWFATGAGLVCSVSPSARLADARVVCRLPAPATSLVEDNERVIWAGTAGKGLWRIKSRQLQWISFPMELTDRGSSSVIEAPGQQLLLLDENGWLYRLNGTRFERSSRLPLREGVVVRTICAGEDGEFWVGTRSDGLFWCRGQQARQFSEREGLSDSEITALCRTPDGKVWIGTRNGGLNRLAGGKVTRFNTPWGFQGASASVLEAGENGTIWIGTTGDGLFGFSNGRFKSYTLENGNSVGTVGSLYADPDGVLWIGTLSGLCRLQNGRVSLFPAANPLGEEAIVQLRGDMEGNLWAGSSSGIYRFRKDQLNAYADGKTRFWDVVPYGREDGLPAVQCLPGILSQADSRNRAGLLFATSKGVVVGQRSTLGLNTAPPPVLIESILVQNEPVPMSGRIQVPPGRSSIQFQYTALSLTAPGKVAFRYFLEGCDADWSEVTVARSARYPQVRPGRYTFHVVARNNDGVWNESGANVDLVVSAFWWETYWFRIGVLLAAASAAIFLYRQRVARRREIERLRVRIASDLHDDIGSSLWSINLLSRMLAKHGSLSAEERQDVDEINRIAVQTSNSIRDIIWLINPAFDSMQDLLLRVKDYAATSLRGITFRFKADGVDLGRKLPQTLRQNILFLLKETLTNIGKHSGATEASLVVSESKTHWTFMVADNGSGFDADSDTAGTGLKSMRSRASALGANLEISSVPGHGTTVKLTAAKPSPGILARRRDKAGSTPEKTGAVGNHKDAALPARGA